MSNFYLICCVFSSFKSINHMGSNRFSLKQFHFSIFIKSQFLARHISKLNNKFRLVSHLFIYQIFPLKCFFFCKTRESTNKNKNQTEIVYDKH